MKCVVCKKGPMDSVAVFRINAKGVPGLWACRKHLNQTDAPPLGPTVDAIVSAVEKAQRR